MNLAELVGVVSGATGHEEDVSREIIKTALLVISEEVKREGRVSIVGFGAFYQTIRKSRIGRNPQTGEMVKIPASRVPRFKAGKGFREKLKVVRRVKKS